MASDNDSGQPGGWFPNLNNLLLVLLAGTLLVSQNPFHQSRPSKPETVKPEVRLVDARPWQDPFEAVEKYIEKHPRPPTDTSLESIQAQISAKKSNNRLKKLDVIAVMLPGDPYFEDNESRRKLRYAVLSGFDAALRYMPENFNHIEYFQTYATQKTTGDNKEQNFRHRVAYEWMVYKPSEYTEPPEENERRYHRPPVLVLWLNNSEFSVKPHNKLKSLIKEISKNNYSVIQTHVLGPYNSDTLQDFVNEVFGRSPEWDDGQFNYYSPSATLQDVSLLKNECPQFVSGHGLWPDFIVTSPFENIVMPSDTDLDKPGWSTSCVNEAKLMAYYQKSYLDKYHPKLPKQVNSFDALHEQYFFGKYGNDFLSYYYLNGTYLQVMDISLRYFKQTNLHDYFKDHGISFARVTPTDQDLAIAVKKELEIRGIKPGRNNRVLLIGEWDTLYGWHLPNTYAVELLKDRENKCREEKQQGLDPGKPNEEKQPQLQNWDEIYDPAIQCVFRFSYLRGLDGEKKLTKDNNSEKTANDNKNIGGAKGDAQKLEDADGDSQFDYVRRLVAQVAELDQQIRQPRGPAHAITAIGVLGSDVYDKLLILEALRDKFPDAVFFTNGMDARLLQPEFNPWARNLIVASGFGLTLDRHLQRDIPPFRDSAQAAFFLATQLALAKSIDQKLVFDARLKALAGLTPVEVDGLIQPPRIFELGRTRAFDLSDGATANACSAQASQASCIHPAPKWASCHISGWGILVWPAFILSALLFPAPSRRFLQHKTGFMFTLALLVVTCCLVIFYISHQPNLGTPRGGLAVVIYLLIGLAYSGMMVWIASINDPDVDKETPSWIKSYLPWNVMLILLVPSLIILWICLRPAGLLAFQEQYAFMEGVSMWPSEGLRLLALMLAGYFIIETLRFPKQFNGWLAGHFNLPGFCTDQTLDEWKQTHPASLRGHNYLLLIEWLDWKNWKNTKIEWHGKTLGKRWFYSLGWVIVFYGVFSCVFSYFGNTKIPYRGENMWQLDALLTRGLLVPAFIFLLVLVVDTVSKAVDLAGKCFPDEPDGEEVVWPDSTLARYANLLTMGRGDLQEWVGMRFIDELNRRIYAMIGYPLIIALLMVVARSSYFDNWNAPVAFKLVIASSLALLLYGDYRLKKSAEKARKNALKSLKRKAIQYKGMSQGEKLEQLITLIENFAEDAYKPFSKRPIFLHSLLIVIALLVDSIDYSLLASKFL
ncbi:MAG: hypothetical protein Q7U57_09835 [Methylovulum sp.]|nr:hypothetical protein [Methylovulum sp.]